MPLFRKLDVSRDKCHPGYKSVTQAAKMINFDFSEEQLDKFAADFGDITDVTDGGERVNEN